MELIREWLWEPKRSSWIYLGAWGGVAAVLVSCVVCVTCFSCYSCVERFGLHILRSGEYGKPPDS